MFVRNLIPADAPSRANAQQLSRWLGRSPWTLRRWAAAGIMPAPIRLGPKSIFWDTETVRDWLTGKGETVVTEGKGARRA
jgi:predicted DNA-binding transcriptional regulator AlpA